MIRRFDVIVALYVFGIMVAELMGAKTFPVANVFGFQFNASVAIFVMPLLFTITDIIAEVHGRKRARSVVFSGLIMVFLVMLFGLMATHLPPSVRFAPNEAAYDAIFGASVRIAFASIVAFAVSELLDVAIFTKLREKMKGKALWFRNNASNFISQLVDSAVFVTLAFYAFGTSLGNNVSFLIGIILPYWALRCLFSVAQTPLVYLGVNWLRGEKPEDTKIATEKIT